MLQLVVFYPMEVESTGVAVAMQVAVDAVKPNAEEEATHHVAIVNGNIIAQWSFHFPWVAVASGVIGVPPGEAYATPEGPSGATLN